MSNYSSSLDLGIADRHYFVPDGRVVVKLEVKKSVFIADLARVNNKIESLDFIENIKKNYKDAHHHCWGYIIGSPINPENIGVNDDGEPRGSAGKPIINVLSRNKVGYVVVIVTRYFGGIKLGMGGLIRSYSHITGIALKKISLKRFFVQKNIIVSVPYNYRGLLLSVANKMEATIIDVKYDVLVNFEILLNKNVHFEFVEIIKNKTNDQAIFELNRD